ncbi:unnamed protein product [Malus baccata var. baccata]
MAKKGASSLNPVATWNAHNISIFCDVCIKEVEAGHRPGTHFDKDGYANIRANFKAETGHDYERKQLKNKWDALKNEWKLWKALVGKETGLGWNSSKGTIDASEEWWNNKMQNMENCEKGISLEMEDKLDRMFSSTIASGEHAWAPSSGVLPPESREETVGQIDSYDEEETKTMQDLREASRKGKKRAANQAELRKKKVDKKGKKIGGAAKLCGQIDRLVEAYETRSSANSLMSIFNMNASDDDVEELEDGLIICADCIGAIDGVHVEASIPHLDQVPYIGRKGIPTQNVMAALKIVIATMALHNYIWRYSERDRHFDDNRDFCEESDSSDDDDDEYQNYQVEGSHEIEISRLYQSYKLHIGL